MVQGDMNVSFKEYQFGQVKQNVLGSDIIIVE